MHWFQFGKTRTRGCVLSPCLHNLYGECIMWNARLDESQARTKAARRNIKSLWYANDTTLLAESGEELKNLWMRVREENEKAHLKQHSKNEDHGIWFHYSMANRKGNVWKQWEILFSWAPKSLQMVTVAMNLRDAYSMEVKVGQI